MPNIPKKVAEDGRTLYGLASISRPNHYVTSIDRVTRDSRPGAFKYAHDDGAMVWYRKMDRTPLLPAIAVSQQEGDNWAEKSQEFRKELSRLNYDWLLEVCERLSPDNLLCAAYHDCPVSSAPVIVTGKRWWCPINYPESSSLLSDFWKGQRAYLTSDGRELWEIRALRAPLYEGGGWLVEIARKRVFGVTGVESVIGTAGLPFVQNEERRKSLEHRVEKIESELEARMDVDVIGDCSEVCEALLTAIGLQRLAGDLEFGEYKSEEHFRKRGALRKMLDAFRPVLSDVAAEDAKWLPDVVLATEAMKFWCEWKKHDVKAQRSKLSPDGSTAHTCYGALRDLIRICRWVHESHPEVLSPKAAES